VDLLWNPSRLEQRLGRIKRFGQARHTVDMLNLVYHDTQDEQVYQVLSRRLRDKFDIFGGLPDTIEDDWIESVEKLEAMMDTYIHLRQQGRDVFALRYKEGHHRPRQTSLGTVFPRAGEKGCRRETLGILVAEMARVQKIQEDDCGPPCASYTGPFYSTSQTGPTTSAPTAIVGKVIGKGSHETPRSWLQKMAPRSVPA
jgi:hypothetical protein